MQLGGIALLPLLFIFSQPCIAAAAMKEGKAIGHKLSPVIIIPGDGGNQIEARLTDKPSAPHWFCAKNSDWFRLWLDPSQLLPGYVDCWADNMRQVYDPQTSTYSNAPGVEIRPVGWGDTSGMEYLDPNVRVGDAVMFGRLVDALVSSGGERGVSIRGAPYDFRTVPGAAYMAHLKELVEETVAANEGRPAVLLSHSMGCLVTLRFLRSMSPSWKRKFVKHWLAVSAPFGGSEGTVRLFASGNNMGVSAVSAAALRGEQRTSEANFWLLPSPAVYGGSVLATTNKRNYTALDYEAFFTDINFPEGIEQYQRVRNLYSPDDESFPDAAGVTHCYGQGIDTPARLTWPEGNFEAGPTLVETGDGDGTVGIDSLRAFETHWKATGRFRAQAYGGLAHATILRDDTFLADMMRIVGWPPLNLRKLHDIIVSAAINNPSDDHHASSHHLKQHLPPSEYLSLHREAAADSESPTAAHSAH